jgi:hypothetical protein
MGGDGRLSPLHDWYDPRFVDRVRALFRRVVEVETLIEAVKLVRMSPKDERGDLLLSLMDDVETFLREWERMDVELSYHLSKLLGEWEEEEARRR